MKILSRLFNLILTVIVIYLLLQNITIRNKLAALANQPHPPPTTTVSNSPSWQDPDLQGPYPEIIPSSVTRLIEAFQPQEGQYNQKQIRQVVDEINDRDLRNLFSSVAWQSAAGQALTAKLIALEIIDHQQLRRLPSMDFKDLTPFRRCLLEPSCYELFAQCALNIKCCLFRYPCYWPCRACYRCWYPCCSTSIKMGMIGDPPVYKSVKKIKFQTGDTFSVTIDASDSSLGIVTMANGNSASLFTPAEKTALLDHMNDTSSNPHHVTKADIINPGSLITSADLAPDAVTADKIASNAVGSAEIAADAVGTTEIANNSVGSVDLAPDSVTADKIPSNAVGNDEIANNAIDTAKIADGTILGADITSSPTPSDKIPESKINFPSPATHNHNGVYLPATGNVVVNGELYKKIGGTCYNVAPSNWQATGCP